MAVLNKLYKKELSNLWAKLRGFFKNCFFYFRYRHKERKTLAIALRLKASSLTEVLVATVIILMVFGIATTTLNTIMLTTVKNKRYFITTELNQLVYEYEQGIIKLPYAYQEGEWFINSSIVQENKTTIVLFEAKHKTNNQKITRKTIANDTN